MFEENNRPDWLTARPVAHRGLHKIADGRLENALPAFSAAIAADCAIELDVQLTGDDQLVVFHDDNLERLTTGTGLVRSHDLRALQKTSYKDVEGVIPSLHEVLEEVGGRVPLIIEIKSDWQSYGPRERALANTLAGYQGEVAIMSFDPNIMAAFRETGWLSYLPQGLIAELFPKERWPQLGYFRRLGLRHLLSWKRLKPDFLAFRVDDLPHGPVSRLRAEGVPVLTWTVKTEPHLDVALGFADCPIFEGLDASLVQQKFAKRRLEAGAGNHI